MSSYDENKVSAGDLAEKLVASDLTYTAKSTANVVVERTTKIQYAQSQLYRAGDEVVIDLQTGSDYISFRDSYLKFDLTLLTAGGVVATTGEARFEAKDANSDTAGSVLNVFRTNRAIARSSDVLTHIERANLLAYHKTRYNRTSEWVNQQGKALLGYGTQIDADAVPYSSTFIVPMSLLAPLFDTHELAPNVLCRGMRLELTLEGAAQALVITNTGVPATDVATYILSNVELHLDSYRLSDGALNMLNQQSATNGLVLQYKDYENAQFNKPNTATSASYEMRKTCSMAMGAIAIVRETANLNSEEKDGFKNIALQESNEYQWRIGSTYLPVQKIAGLKQYYAHAVYCNGRFRSHKELGVDEALFNGKVGHACVDISRYFLDNSGLALNNSTSLTWSADGLNAATSTIDLFLCHNRVVTIFLENVVKSN